MLFYQDFNEQFEGYTQPFLNSTSRNVCCFIRISMNNLKDIHNLVESVNLPQKVVLSGFQWTIWRIYTTIGYLVSLLYVLFYQDFNEQFEGYTQHQWFIWLIKHSCFIRISMNNLKDIHNWNMYEENGRPVVLSGFQWTIWRIYTTVLNFSFRLLKLFYQDFNEQFEGYTQLGETDTFTFECCFIRISMNNLKDIHNAVGVHLLDEVVVLSGFQWTIWRIYTTRIHIHINAARLFYQDFNEQFEGYTQRVRIWCNWCVCCFIRISMNNLKDIHNTINTWVNGVYVVLSGFQWTIWRIYTTYSRRGRGCTLLFYQDFNEQFEGYTQHRAKRLQYLRGCFIRISMNNLKDIHNNPLNIKKICGVVLSGFQWTIWRIYTTRLIVVIQIELLFYQDFNEQFEGYTQRVVSYINIAQSCFIRISMNNLKDIQNNRTQTRVQGLVVLSGFQWQFKEYTIRTIYNVLLMNVP